MIMKLRGFQPKAGKNSYIAPNATIIGNVEMGEDVSVLFGAVIRGDVSPIKIGDRCNIQDLCMIHATYEKTETVLEENVSLGHSAIIHGAYIERNTLIGMGAILMDGVRVGAGSIVGAGSLLTENTIIPPGSLVIGRPAKVVRTLSDEEKDKALKASEYYLHYKEWYKDSEIVEMEGSNS